MQAGGVSIDFHVHVILHDMDLDSLFRRSYMYASALTYTCAPPQHTHTYIYIYLSCVQFETLKACVLAANARLGRKSHPSSRVT